MKEDTLDELIKRRQTFREFAQLLASVPFHARNHGLLRRTEADVALLDAEIAERRKAA